MRECIFVSLTQSDVRLGAYSIAVVKAKNQTYQLNEASFRFNFKSKNINRLGELSYLISFPLLSFESPLINNDVGGIFKFIKDLMMHVITPSSD